MNAPLEPGSVVLALRSVIARAAALPPGDAECHVQTCTHRLVAAATSRIDVRAAVDGLVAAINQLQGTLKDGRRRRAQHDSAAVERLLEALQEELLPELRRQGLV
jgi:hypothetical protein